MVDFQKSPLSCLFSCLNCIRHGRNATYERGLRSSFVTARHVCFFHVDNSTPPKNGGKLSSKQIAFITVSVVVGSITAAGVAVFLLRYEGVFVSFMILLVLKSDFLITD